MRALLIVAHLALVACHRPASIMRVPAPEPCPTGTEFLYTEWDRDSGRAKASVCRVVDRR